MIFPLAKIWEDFYWGFCKIYDANRGKISDQSFIFIRFVYYNLFLTLFNITCILGLVILNSALVVILMICPFEERQNVWIIHE